MEEITDERVSFSFANLRLHKGTGTNQWRPWVWTLVSAVGSSGQKGAMWDMALRSFKFGNAEFMLLNKPPLWLTTQSWTLAPPWAPQELGS